MDPDFKLPTVWKASLGYDAELPWYGLIGSVEFQSIRSRDAAFYRAINIGAYNPEPGVYDGASGVMADGRLSYWCTPGSGLNCGMNPDYSYQSPLLGNTDKGYSNSVTFSLNKQLSNGRSEERRVGKECVRTCRSWLSPSHLKKKKLNNHYNYRNT